MTNIPNEVLEIIKDIIAHKESEEETEHVETNLEYLYDYSYYPEHGDNIEESPDKITINL